MDTTELHLKPCPHCGSKAKINVINVINDDPEAPNYQGNYSFHAG